MGESRAAVIKKNLLQLKYIFLKDFRL